LTAEPWEYTVEAILRQAPQQRRTTNIDTGCYHDPEWSQRPSSSSAPDLLEALPWRWHKILSGSVGGLYPCLLQEQTYEKYTALVFLDYYPRLVMILMKQVMKTWWVTVKKLQSDEFNGPRIPLAAIQGIKHDQMSIL